MAITRYDVNDALTELINRADITLVDEPLDELTDKINITISYETLNELTHHVCNVLKIK